MNPLLHLGTPDPTIRRQLDRLADHDQAIAVHGLEGHDGITTVDHLHLVAHRCPEANVDVVVADQAQVNRLWWERLVGWAANLRAGHRAPRARQVELVAHRPAWTAAAARLTGRMLHAAPVPILHAHHVGSTAVPGLEAKPIIDLQLVLDAIPDPSTTADWGRAAGVVAVSGDFYAIDRHNTRHPEAVLVDADPGQSVNIHLHAESSPVWREVLIFRDWLRADPDARAEYQQLKHHLARSSPDGPPAHVDDYSRGKRAWINHAVNRAGRTRPRGIK